jgi:hypothetical protein
MPALFQCSSIAMIFTLMSDLTHHLLSQPYTIRSTTVEWGRERVGEPAGDQA